MFCSGGLTPQLSEEIDFFSKLYNEDIGRIIYSVVTTKNRRQNNCFEEVIFFLKNREGRSDAWIERFIECFRGVFGEQTSAKDDFLRVKNAVENGDVRGERSLAYMYCCGMGVKQDFTEAAYYYKKAVDKGDSLSQYWLGVFYRTRLGVVSADENKSIYYYMLSAKVGNIEA